MKNVAFIIVILWVMFVMAACQTNETPPAATPCGVDTAVTVTLLDETNTQLDGVQVSYRVNGGEWVAYPERVNGRVTLSHTPGTFEIRAQKPGYETTTTVVPLSAFTCEGEPAQVTISVPYALCVDDPDSLRIQLSATGSPILSAVGPDGRDRHLQCQKQGANGCQTYTLFVANKDIGIFSLEASDLPGLGELQIVDGVVVSASEPFTVTLTQGNRQQTFDLTAVESATFTLPVVRDEVGCPLLDLNAVALATTAAYPEPSVYLGGSLLMTDLGAEVCQQTSVLTDITYVVTLPPGTNLDDVEVIYWRDEEWLTAVCRLEDDQYLCTAQLPNPLINQTYSVRLVINGQEYIGTQLPASNLCIVFSN